MGENTKKKAPYEIVLTVIVTVLAVLVILFSLSALTSIGKDYSSLFGLGSVAVKTDSMKSSLRKGDTFECDGIDVTCRQNGFNANDVIFIKIVDGKPEASELKVGDVITFRTSDDDGNSVLLTHRIVKVNNTLGVTSYTTKGDANSAVDDRRVVPDEVVGVYTNFKLPIVGAILIFLKSSIGFLVMVVVPCFLILGYAIFKLVLSIKEERKAAVAEAKGTVSDEEREKIRQELIKEMEKASTEKEVKESEDPKEE